jgi:hypothetical protein
MMVSEMTLCDQSHQHNCRVASFVKVNPTIQSLTPLIGHRGIEPQTDLHVFPKMNLLKRNPLTICPTSFDNTNLTC